MSDVVGNGFVEDGAAVDLGRRGFVQGRRERYLTPFIFRIPRAPRSHADEACLSAWSVAGRGEGEPHGSKNNVQGV